MADADEAAAERPEVVHHDLEGLTVSRVPLSMPDFATSRILASLQFHAANQRDAPVRLALLFAGDNLKVHTRTHTHTHTHKYIGCVPLQVGVCTCTPG
jgi:hypothetical protein